MYVTCGGHEWPHCREGYISFYLNKESYELNFSAFNSIFGFSSSMDLPYRHVPKDFTHMLFGTKFLVIISMIQATPKTLLLETLVLEWHRDCLLVIVYKEGFLVVCLLGRIV